MIVFGSCKKEKDIVKEIEDEIDNPTDSTDTTGATNPLITTLLKNFESGSIGQYVKNSNTDWDIYLADDNNNSGLPDTYRNWWYVKFNDVEIDSVTQIRLRNRGWPYFYAPVYSYNQVDWFRFNDTEVNKNYNDELIMRKQFEEKEVWIARFYPYTYTDLKDYISTIEDNPNVTVETPGYTQGGRPLYLIKITDPDVVDPAKKRVLIHARSHPAEVPPSFVIEGLVDFMLSGVPEALELLAETEVYIFPIHNIDGVIVGNYRTTPQSENLEVMWYYDVSNPLNLTSSAPAEVNVVHNLARTLMTDGGEPVTIALNLHATNSEPDVRPYFFPHFGPTSQGYSTQEAALWDKQIAFIGNLATHYGAHMLEPIPSSGGSSFATKKYPESWWWKNFKEDVMAITMEMTYGRAGYAPQWVEPDDYRNLGAALAMGIKDYYDGVDPSGILSTMSWSSMRAKLKYPELYPPNAVDEGKE